MSVLESQVEALAFNYVSYGILAVVNNLWTWLAVVTAAVSFWRIKATSAAGGSAISRISSAESYDRTADMHRSSEPAPLARASPAPVSEPLVCGDGVTKGKFAVYFEDDCDGELDDGDCDGEVTAVREDVGALTVIGGDVVRLWERKLRVRKGEEGWYGYQDLTVINGNVVRLWDGCW